MPKLASPLLERPLSWALLNQAARWIAFDEVPVEPHLELARSSAKAKASPKMTEVNALEEQCKRALNAFKMLDGKETLTDDEAEDRYAKTCALTELDARLSRAKEAQDRSQELDAAKNLLIACLVESRLAAWGYDFNVLGAGKQKIPESFWKSGLEIEIDWVKSSVICEDEGQGDQTQRAHRGYAVVEIRTEELFAAFPLDRRDAPNDAPAPGPAPLAVVAGHVPPAYIPPYLGLMIDAIRQFGLDGSNEPKVNELRQWFLRRTIEGASVSNSPRNGDGDIRQET